MELPSDTSGFSARLNGEDSAVWLEGDVLSFLHRSSGKVVRTTGGIQEPMSKIPETDLWLLQLRMTAWDKAMVSYGFIDDNKPTQLKQWKGGSAPELVDTAAPLQGRVVQRLFHSAAIAEDRILACLLYTS